MKSGNKTVPAQSADVATALVRQGWISLAAWIGFGLLVEGLIGYRTPALADDALRRELFRLAHAHGTLLNLALIAAAICARIELVRLGPATALGLRCAAVLLPVGFLTGGLWHFEGDPGLGIALVPLGALVLLASALQIALTTLRR